MTVIFIVIVLISIVCLITKHISFLALIFYMQMKGYKEPSRDEMNECVKAVISHMIHDFLHKS